jgi:hypothetical protein
MLSDNPKHRATRLVLTLLVTSWVLAAALYYVKDTAIRRDEAAQMRLKANARRLDSAEAAANVVAGTPSAPTPPDVSTLPPVRVLFIGNSLVSTENMPEMLVELARLGGVNLQVTQHAPDGGTFEQHDASPQVRVLLNATGWHFVVLQEQSQRPAQSDEWLRDNVEPHAVNLARRAKASSRTARVVFYVTPAREGGDLANARSVPALATYGGTQDRITNTYRRLATQLNADLALAGEAWRRVRNEHPEIELYGDPVHPNHEGAYLIACVFYATLFNKSPVGSRFTAGIDTTTARVLQRAAWETARTRVSASFRP